MKCLICQKEQLTQLSLATLFSWKALSEGAMCPSCRRDFVRINRDTSCSVCMKKGGHPLCSDCKEWLKTDELGSIQHRVLFEYNDAMQEWFKTYKFVGDIRLASCFKEDLQHAMKKYKGWVITVIPLGEKRLEERGFNQVGTLLDVAGISFIEVFDKRVEEDESQSSKTREGRLASRQPFNLRSDCEEDLSKANVLIVDDVYTTGRTLRFACEILSECEVSRIETFSLAR